MIKPRAQWTVPAAARREIAEVVELGMTMEESDRLLVDIAERFELPRYRVRGAFRLIQSGLVEVGDDASGD